MSDNKYVYKPYSPLFPELFEKEKQRIAVALPYSCKIEHVGSTSIEGLGGKGIIDIAIATDHKNLKEIAMVLQNIGYEFRPSFSTEERLYFVIFLPDPIEQLRRYHIHLTDLLSSTWHDLIAFRD